MAFSKAQAQACWDLPSKHYSKCVAELPWTKRALLQNVEQVNKKKLKKIYILYIYIHTHTRYIKRQKYLHKMHLIHTHTQVWELKYIYILNVFYAHQGCIYLIKYTILSLILLNITLWNSFSIFLLFLQMFYLKAEFQQPLLQSSVSHDTLEIILLWWFAAQETFFTIIIVENSGLIFFSWQSDTFSWFFGE